MVLANRVSLGVFEQLWIDGRRAVRATSPNRFFHFAADGVRETINPQTGRKEYLGRRAFIARPQEFAALSAVPADQLREVTIVAYHSWEAGLHRVGFVDAPTAMVMTTAEAPYTFSAAT